MAPRPLYYRCSRTDAAPACHLAVASVGAVGELLPPLVFAQMRIGAVGSVLEYLLIDATASFDTDQLKE